MNLPLIFQLKDNLIRRHRNAELKIHQFQFNKKASNLQMMEFSAIEKSFESLILRLTRRAL